MPSESRRLLDLFRAENAWKCLMADVAHLNLGAVDAEFKQMFGRLGRKQRLRRQIGTPKASFPLVSGRRAGE